jgi:hypothetical protein
MTVYYTQKDFNSSDLENYVTAFPPVSPIRPPYHDNTNSYQGFRMTVGSPSVTTRNGTQKGLAYTCLDTILTRGRETPDFPSKPCPAGSKSFPFPDKTSQRINPA